MRSALLGAFFLCGAAALGQTPTITSVTNAGSGDTRLSPGVLASIYGSGFTAASPLSVMVSGLNAPIVGTPTPSQITVQFPYNLPTGSVSVVVQEGSLPYPYPSAPFSVNISAFAPAYVGISGAAFTDGSFNPFTAAKPASPGKQAVAYMVGLGGTNPPVDAGQSASSPTPTNAKPTLTVGGKLATVNYCGLASGIVGTYQVTFTVPPDVSAGNQPVVFTIGGVTAPPATLPTSVGVPGVVGLRSSATGQLKDATHGAAPNSFVSVYASNLANQDTGSQNLFPASSFQGDSVLFNGKASPLYHHFGSLNQIDLVLPSELPESGTVNVTVQNATGPSAAFVLTMAPLDVGLFRIADPGNPNRNNGAVLVANTAWIVMPASMAMALKVPSCAGLPAVAQCGQPAAVGDVLQIYFTGGGKATPNGDPNKAPLPTGTVAPADGSVIYQTVQQPALTIGGVPAKVLFSGIAPGNAGLYQVNAAIPTGVQPGDDVPMVLSIGASSDTATIAVK